MRLIWLLVLPTFAVGQSPGFVRNGPSRAGETVVCPLPVSEHQRNRVGRDGLGLCVFTSIDLAARWQNVPALVGLRDYMTRFPGGGWPEKVDTFVAQCAAERGLPTPRYVQHVGGDVAFLKLALKTRRYVCVTYRGKDGVYYPGAVAHMVNLVHLTERTAVIQNNNFPGEWLWMSADAFRERWTQGGGWAVVLLDPAPPPLAPLAEEVVDYGVDTSRFDLATGYRLDGKDVSAADAYAAFGTLPDDSDRPYLTCVGDDATRATFGTLATALGERVRTQAYAPSHWTVAACRLKAGITLHAADGTLLHTWSNVPSAAEVLAVLEGKQPTLPNGQTLGAVVLAVVVVLARFLRKELR